MIGSILGVPLRSPQAAEDGKPPVYPIVLSALVLPGAGQLAQRRWMAAGLFAALFIVTFLGSLYYFFTIIVAFYKMGLDFDQYEPGSLPILRAVMAFVMALLIYIINVVDVYIAYRRAATAWSHRRLKETGFIED